MSSVHVKSRSLAPTALRCRETFPFDVLRDANVRVHTARRAYHVDST
jgi:hypothetical protein